MKTRHRFLAGFGLAALAIAIMGQVGLTTMPPNTVFGRIGVGAFGPGGAVPLSTLAANLGIGVPAHNVAIGTGSNSGSFVGAAPSSPGQILIDQGGGVDAQFKPVTGSCTIDLNGVTSCGALGGGVTLLSAVAPYTVLATDCFKTIQAGTGATGSFTITLPGSTSGFSNGCRLQIYNGDSYLAATSRGKVLSGFPADCFYILFPHQTCDIMVSNGAFVATRPQRRWAQTSVQLFVANSGSDTANDCLSLNFPCKTIQHAGSIVYNNVDNQSSSPTILLKGGDSFPECVVFQGQFTGYNVGLITSSSGTGTSGGATWGNVTGSCASNALLTVADNAEWQVQNLNITNASGTSGIFGLFVHQTGVIDILDGMAFGPMPGSFNLAIDHNGSMGIGASYTIGAGPAWLGFLTMGGAGTFSECGACTTTFAVSPRLTTMYTLVGAGATLLMGPTHVFSGSATITNACTVTGPSMVSLSDIVIPGTNNCAAGATHGGQVF
jgi:hypothetical protein